MDDTHNRGQGPQVAVLGTGIMGSAMARNLIAAELPHHGVGPLAFGDGPLAEAGARVADSPNEAVQGAPIVITMLPTADVVKRGDLRREGGGSILAGSGVGTDGHDRPCCHDRGRRPVSCKLRPDVLFVDAPVSGSKGPAEAGQLLILASGPAEANAILNPAFSAIGRKTVWLGEAGQGSRMKLVVNAYMSALIEGVAEALELADQLGVDSSKLADAIEGGPLDAPIADAKLHKMERGDFAPEFPLEWALKDVDLALAAAGGNTTANADSAVPAVADRRRRRSRSGGCECCTISARRPCRVWFAGRWVAATQNAGSAPWGLWSCFRLEPVSGETPATVSSM